jgi:hypothetical protein
MKLQGRNLEPNVRGGDAKLLQSELRERRNIRERSSAILKSHFAQWLTRHQSAIEP